MAGRFPPALRPQRHPLRSSPPVGTQDENKSIISDDTIDAKKSSLDLTQRLEKKLAEFNASDNVFKRWILEITCWTISALCMGAVAGIYVRVNGHSMSGSEQLLTSVNVLGKVAAASLIVPTSEALGQLKWNWFHKSRAMWDFEIFDKASRGPWGAVMLLFRTKGRSLAAFGALLIVLLLAIDTFFQQVIEYPDRWRMIGVLGEIPRVIHYEPVSPPQYFQHSESGVYNRELLPVVKEYYFYNGTQPVQFGNGTRPDIPLSCPTSNCTWPVYDTLAVCSRCQEISTVLDITQTCMVTAVDWSANWTGPITEEPYPNKTVCGHFLNVTSAIPILLSGYILEDSSQNMTGESLLMRTIPLTGFDDKVPAYGAGSVVFREVRNPILDGLVASAVNDRAGVLRGEAPIVHECILSWCVQTLESSYNGGQYRENIIAEFWNTTSEPMKWPWEAEQLGEGNVELTYWQNVSIQPPLSAPAHDAISTTYSVHNDTIFEVMALFDDYFPSFYTVQDAVTEPLIRYKNYFNGPWTQTLDFNAWQAPNNLTHHVERMATSITNVIRSSTSKKMLHGNAYEVEKYVSVQWAWLIFPFALLLLSLAFLVSTMIKTSKDTATGVWKTSAMPTLIYGLPEETRGKFTAQSTWSSSHGDVKKVRIKLLPNLGWRVSGQNLLKSPLLPMRKDQPPPGWI